MAEDFVAAQYDAESASESALVDPYGYYNESGEYVYYQTDQPSEIEAHTDQGIVYYQPMEVNGQTLYVDREGRLLNPDKLQGVWPSSDSDRSTNDRRTRTSTRTMKSSSQLGSHNESHQLWMPCTHQCVSGL
jgi:hypothetical protein